MSKHTVKIFHTAPVAFMQVLEQHQDFLFIEAHAALENKKYADYLVTHKTLKPNVYVIMDNSAYLLGGPMSEKDFMRAYEYFIPDCIIALDHPYSRKKTLDATESFVARYKKQIDAKIMAVPQGETYADYISCFWRLCENPDVDVIGVNMFMDWEHPDMSKLEKTERICRYRNMILWNAHDIVRMATENKRLPKSLHLLGITSGRELTFIRDNNLFTVKSCDSSSAFIHGYYGVKYGPKGLKAKDWDHKLDFSIKEVTDEQRKNILHNIKILNRLRGANVTL